MAKKAGRKKKDATDEKESAMGADTPEPAEVVAGDAQHSASAVAEETAVPDDDGGAQTADAADERVAELLAAVEEEKDRALRTLAEFDNYRRRSLREREEAAARGMADVLRDLLDVADNFDRALEHAGDDVPKSFLEGMDLVARGLHDLLDRFGVARMEAEGRPFDPELHDALTRAPSEDAPPNTVVQVVQPGYLINDRVLRPAKVIVAAPMPQQSEAPTDDVREDA